MTEAKHTPGPWEYDETGGGQVRAVDSLGSFPICDIRGWGHLTGKGSGALGLSDAEAYTIQEANARLIAAAPDMLEKLIWLSNEILGSLPLLEEQCRRDMGNTNYSLLIQRATEARAAIAKATGDQC